MTDKKDLSSSLSKASAIYEKNTGLRAAVALVPYVGGSLDMIFSGRGSKIRQERLVTLMRCLEERLSKVEAIKVNPDSEEFYDLIMEAMEAATRSKSKEKIKRLAYVVVNQTTQNAPWSEADDAIRLINNLTDTHFRILIVIMTSEIVSSGPFANFKILSLNEKKNTHEGINLSLESFPEIEPLRLKMHCSELVSMGLLYDEGIGRLDTRALQFVRPTDLSNWLLNWIAA